MSTSPGEPPSQPFPDRPTEPLSCPDAPHKAWRPVNPFASFRHATDGIVETFQHERNFRFHFVAALLVLVAGLILHLSLLRIIAVIGSVALVLITELLNTAIESTVDLAMPAHHPLARRAKDAGAGAVLIAALFAVVVGILVFIPALVPYVRAIVPNMPVVAIAAALFVVGVGAFALVRRSAFSSLRSSQKMVIGVTLTLFGAACAYPVGSSLASPARGTVSGKRAIASTLVRIHPALPSSAGVS